MSLDVFIRPRVSRPLITLLALTAGLAVLTGPVFAAQTPAEPVPGPEAGANARWDFDSPLQPAMILGDTTWFAGHSDPKEGNVLEYHALDVEDGILFTATGQGVTVHDIRSGPATASTYLYGWFTSGHFPGWEHVGDSDWFIKHIDAPAGNGTIAAATMDAQGFAVINAANPAGSFVAYQAKTYTNQVYAVRVAGTDWAYALGDAGKVVRFNMSATASMNECLDNPIGTCPGVHKGLVTSVNTDTWVALAGAGQFLATGKWLGGGPIKIWNLSDPAAPSLALQVNASARGLGMWRVGSNYYLARMDSTGKRLAIHDVSCIAAGACSNAPEIWSQTLTSPSVLPYVTASVDAGKAYLYVGGDDYGSCAPQREYIFDVTTPASPSELTPKKHPDGYWGWYYQDCPTGFTLVGPRIGQVYGGYLYRAANSILDAHKLGGPTVPTADFSWSPATIYPGTPVDFTDQSSGNPSLFSWTFAGGTPGTSFAENPLGVSFSAPGQYNVTLIAENDIGPSTPVTQTITVLDPSPVIGSVSASPLSAYVCQPFTFTANNVGGQPTVTLGWSVTGPSGPYGGGNVNPFGWTPPQTATPGTYTATATASNGVGSVSKGVTVTVQPLVALPGAGSWTPGNDPFAAGVVTFHADATGATEWSWDFGDSGGVFGPWTTDPVAGPNPSHSYTAVGKYDVRVRVKNCAEAERTSAVLQVDIKQITPLAVQFGYPSATFECQLLGYCTVNAGASTRFTITSTGTEFWDADWNGDGIYEDANHALTPGDSGKTFDVFHTYSAATATAFTPQVRVRRGVSEEVIGPLAPYQIKVAPAVPPSISIAGVSSGSLNQSYAFTATAFNCSPTANGWSWTTGGGSGTSDTDKVNISWSSTGGKTVTVTNSACSGATGSRTVTILGSGGGGGGGGGGFTPNFAYNPQPVKAGVATTFDASSSTGSPTSFGWTFGDGSAGVFGNPTSHTFANPGTYTVTLVASKDGTCTGSEMPGLCVKSKVVQLAVIPNGPPPPLAAFTVGAGATCISEFGFEQCGTTTGTDVSFVDASTGTVDSRSWDFGDGGTGTGSNPVHRFNKPGTYTVTLTAQGNGQSSQATKSINVTGPAVDDYALVLTWFQRSTGVLSQTSDFYAFNSRETALPLTVTYLKRGTPNPTPPQKLLQVAPRATLFVPDALKTLFGLNEGSGFLYFTWEGTDAPVITGTNNTKLEDGTTFGQSFAAVKVAKSSSSAKAATAIADEHLVGLADIASESFSTFGISNPFDAPAQIELQFTNGAGAPLRPALPVTIARNGQVLYQIVDIRALGVQNQDNYRISVKTLSGGPVLPFAKKLRVGSSDQAYVPAIKTNKSKVFLLGAFSGTTVRGNLWATDAVLFNPTGDELVVDVQFVPVGTSATPSSISTVRLQPRESRRLVDVVQAEWNILGVAGYLSFETKNGGSGPYAGVLGEIYDSANPAKVYGNVFSAMSEDDAADPGESLALVGLMQNAAFSTTLWIYNPGPGPMQTEIVYRASSDGRELARTITGQPEGVMRLINPIRFPEAVQNLSESFTVEMNVVFGRLMASGLMQSSATHDPTYVVGAQH